MPQQNLQQFFASKLFDIPQYQRSYSWDRANVRELHEDLIEGLQAKSSHYIGTIVLARTSTPNRFLVVDGQQRLTTIIMFISVVIGCIKDPAEREYWIRYYIRSPARHKLEPLTRDRDFYFKLLSGNDEVEPQSKSQRCLLEAYEEMQNLLKSTPTKPETLLDAFGSLEILEFIEDDETDAIRIFQTVNDRGKELSRIGVGFSESMECVKCSRKLLATVKDCPHLANFLCFIRCGISSSTPNRRFLSSS